MATRQRNEAAEPLLPVNQAIAPRAELTAWDIILRVFAILGAVSVVSGFAFGIWSGLIGELSNRMSLKSIRQGIWRNCIDLPVRRS
jgi:hypothetical protein